MKNRIIPHFPQTDTLISPFLGGAKIELRLAKAGVQIIANDMDTAVINVWRHLQESKEELLQLLYDYYLNPSEEHLKELLVEYKEEGFLNGLENAAKYLALNPSIVNGKMNRNAASLKRKLSYFENGNPRRSYFHMGLFNMYSKMEYKPFKLFNEDWESFMNKQDSDTFAYLDPPYIGVTLGAYEHEFTWEDHERLYLYLRTRSNFCLSYKNNEQIREWYNEQDFKIVPLNYYRPSANAIFKTVADDTELLIMK